MLYRSEITQQVSRQRGRGARQQLFELVDLSRKVLGLRAGVVDLTLQLIVVGCVETASRPVTAC